MLSPRLHSVFSGAGAFSEDGRGRVDRSVAVGCVQLDLVRRRRCEVEEAARHINIEYEELTPLLTIEDALAASEILYPPDNVFKRFLIGRGDVDEGFARADFIIEGEYRVPHQEQLYIENNGANS